GYTLPLQSFDYQEQCSCNICMSDMAFIDPKPEPVSIHAIDERSIPPVTGMPTTGMHNTHQSTPRLKSGSQGMRHKCDYPGCVKTFARKHDMSRHRQIHDKAKARRYTCHLCHKTFGRNDGVRRHQRYSTVIFNYFLAFTDTHSSFLYLKK